MSTSLRSQWPLPSLAKSNAHDPDAPVETIASATLIEQVRESVVGRDQEIATPFGRRMLTYADFTASGRLVSQIEDFMLHEVGPMYSNTHSDLSFTGRQTNHYREEARAIVQQHLGADSSEFAVIFAGTGMTGCVNKLVDCLGIRLPTQLAHLKHHVPDEQRPVVFISHMEHHSNILVWRESTADVIEVPEVEETGGVDLDFLRSELTKYSNRRMRIVSVSAGSNVSGIVTDLTQIASAARDGGAYLFADYAAAGPYVDMSMRLANGVELDALFLSPHKFIGGPGAAGVLVARRSLISSAVPSQPGGGTVSWVDSDQHTFASAVETREEGGTPAILQAIRAGVAFQLRKLVTVEATQELSSRSCARAIERWRAHPNIVLMGADRSEYYGAQRLPIVSFNIAFDPPTGTGHADESSHVLRCRRMLHPTFVCALLNDLYGIQARAGCSCAGPYGIRLWGLTRAEVLALRALVARTGVDAAKPGWCRVNLCWSMTDDEVDLVIGAVEQLATHGWKLLPLYETAWQSGAYRHRAFDESAHVKWICVVCADRHDANGKASSANGESRSPRAPTRADTLEQARVVYERARELAAPHARELLRPGGDFVGGDAGRLAEDGLPNADAEAREWMRAHYAFPSDAARELGLHDAGASSECTPAASTAAAGESQPPARSEVAQLVASGKERRGVCAS